VRERKNVIVIKKAIKPVLLFFLKLFARMSYNKKYLQGKWFDSKIDGWLWCWRAFWDQKVKGYNRHVKFPVHPASVVGNPKNIEFHPDNIDNFWKAGCYYQCWNGRITIGKGTWIAQNVGIITENHDPLNLEDHQEAKNVVIGENCWIGMNSVILPGVVLGDNTIVGAGAVVTHSFEEGNCIICGVPAKMVRKL